MKLRKKKVHKHEELAKHVSVTVSKIVVNNNNSWIALYHVQIYKLAALYIIYIKIHLTIKKAQIHKFIHQHQHDKKRGWNHKEEEEQEQEEEQEEDKK